MRGMTKTTPNSSGLAEPTSEQDRTFQGWRAEALMKMPYLAPTLFSFRVLSEPGLGTFAVDSGHRLYIDFDEVATWGNVACAEALLHECMHLLQDHAALAVATGVKDSERKAWNLAGDASINDDLRDAGCDFIASTGMLPSSIGAPDYQTAPVYMDILRKKIQQQKQKQAGSGPGQQGNQSGQGDQQSGQSGQGQQGPYKGCGSGAGGRPAPNELGEDDMGGRAPAATAVERELVKINTAAAINQHVATKGIGSVPAGLREFAEMQMQETKTPWDRIMQALVRRYVKKKQGMKDVDFTRRSRRNLDTRLTRTDGTLGSRIVVPGWKAPTPTVRFYRDTSGSMSGDDLARVSSEVMSISRRLGIRGKDLMVQDVDVKVYDAKAYTGQQVLKEVTGRGGTSMEAALEHAWNLPRNERPAVVVVATDGGTGWPPHRGPVPVVVLLVGTSDYLKYIAPSVPDWAHTVLVDVADLREKVSA